jgi:hypothetical protein
MYGEPKEHDCLNFYLLVIEQAWYKSRDDQDKLATWHEMF